jgi:cytochrome c peroxidase
MAGDTSAGFTMQEKNGLRIFRRDCASCHKEPLLTNFSFQSNFLPPDSLDPDSGRFHISRRKEDVFKFKVPGLRNIERTYPYMHDGRFRTLKQVLGHYEASGHAGTKKLPEVFLTGDKEKKDLIAFLLTLTDTTFLRNKSFQHPAFKK